VEVKASRIEPRVENAGTRQPRMKTTKPLKTR